MIRRKMGDVDGALLADWQIRHCCQGDNPLLTPFVEETTGPGIISYGLSSYGYDIRVGSVFRVCVGNYYAHGRIMDPKQADPLAFREIEGDCVIPPNSFALAESVETFNIPRDILVVCLGKSTYARCGIIVNVTPLEPEWRGKLTIEISNTTPIPAKIYANEGIAQLLFFRGDAVCEKSYADKAGKYQNQAGLTLARMPTAAITDRGDAGTNSEGVNDG